MQLGLFILLNFLIKSNYFDLSGLGLVYSISMIKAILVTFVFFVGFKAQALDIVTDCSDLPMLQEAWKNRYYNDFFEASRAHPPMLECQNQGMQNNPYILAKTLWFIENAKTDIPGFYYQKAKKLVNRINAASALKYNGNGCAVADEVDVGLITLFGCFFKGDSKSSDSFNFIYRASIFIHEIRHIELGSNVSKHMVCSSGIECDPYHSEDIQSALSYSYEILYLKDLLRNNNFSPDIQKAIRSNIESTIENHFPKSNNSKKRSSSVSK